ncbi:hypothetical protein CGCS363_v012801 [Colletotrichum siamense]|uniref:uncharacterized protein n=1 Tax=Colletotrichum siamense TaxID=690259 RepID=UPI0018733484|nr:uncharacterized protein CGCS363_v012801 [Colletotrichum siamense]KAF5487002.1 hypothetical protein CGCS363_v012801 [Colletotrichum siamense]
MSSSAPMLTIPHHPARSAKDAAAAAVSIEPPCPSCTLRSRQTQPYTTPTPGHPDYWIEKLIHLVLDTVPGMEEKMTERHAERNQILRLVRTFCGVEFRTKKEARHQTTKTWL